MEIAGKFDVVARARKAEVVFEGATQKGVEWIERNWMSDTFITHDLLNASEHVKSMMRDGLSVALLCAQ